MDLLEDANFLGLNSSKHLPVYSKSLNLRPHTILPSGKVNGSVIADGCVIGGYIDHSSVAYRSYISKGAHVEDSVLLEDVYIGENAYIKNVIVNRGVRIPNNYRCIRSNVILITQENLLEVGDIFG
jgi:glucose-1-phosphate adenylyltransferase